jgi:hypothetical protein
MNTFTSRVRGRHTIGVAAVILTGTGLLVAPHATASQNTGDGRGDHCTLAVWYAVHNPSIAKPRGHQDAQDGRTAPAGPCPV